MCDLQAQICEVKKKNLETDFLQLFQNLPNELIKCFVDPFVKNLQSVNQFAKPSIDIREDEMLWAKYQQKCWPACGMELKKEHC